MKKLTAALLAALLLSGCGSKSIPTVSVPLAVPPETEAAAVSTADQTAEIPYRTRFDAVTEIVLSDEGIQLPEDSDAVFLSHDIIYYEDLETYASGNPYGEGKADQRHSAEEAAAHTVVNIAKPGIYRVTGKLSAGQIRVDLGEDAREDENAVVELILEDADITCTVAPAILFLNVYECDGNWSAESATAEVDTTAAGANLVLKGSNTVTGSHVAKIFKDKEEEKKLWKQDGAIYSYMSMNVFGPGSLELTADNEGLDTELHLTLNGGNISIYSGNDGINTNEDGVSVTTINAGTLTIFAGLDKEGDGIDSNGYLVINGGKVFSAAHPAADAGLDSDLGSYIHGGTVIALGSTMDWAESDSEQVTMNLQFAQQQKAGSQIRITGTDGREIFSFTNDGSYARNFSGLILSHSAFTQGDTYHVYVDGQQMAYTGNDVGFGPGGMGRPGGKDFPGGPMPGDREMPEDFDPSQFFGGKPGNFGPGQRPDQGNREDRMPPEGFPGEMPPDMEMPEGFDPGRNFGDRSSESGELCTDFYINDKVNAFSGVTAA